MSMPDVTRASRIAAIALAAAVIVGLAPAPAKGAPGKHRPLRKIIVTTAADLADAMSQGNEGKQILVRAGEYEIGQPLTVPDDVTLVGEGVMGLDDERMPAGIEPAGRTVLRASPGLVGDLLTLGDGVTIRGLVVEDVVGRQSGNPVVVSSRAPGDFVSALIADCEVINPNPSGIFPAGPTGHGVVAITRNPNLGLDPPPHDGAGVRLRMTRSIVRSPGGGIALFGINFASYAEVRLILERNVIGGQLSSSGGVSRPDAVTGSRVVILSDWNRYRSDVPALGGSGWNLIGGTTAPIPNLASQASTSNSLQIYSRNDRIEGYDVGILAMGARRLTPLSENSSSNRLEMNLLGTRLQTTEADFQLYGAASYVPGVATGDENTARLLILGATGSGPRDNQYFHSWSPTMADLGSGNELQIVGRSEIFDRANENVVPAPPAEFFTRER